MLYYSLCWLIFVLEQKFWFMLLCIIIYNLSGLCSSHIRSSTLIFYNIQLLHTLSFGMHPFFSTLFYYIFLSCILHTTYSCYNTVNKFCMIHVWYANRQQQWFWSSFINIGWYWWMLFLKKLKSHLN